MDKIILVLAFVNFILVFVLLLTLIKAKKRRGDVVDNNISIKESLDRLKSDNNDFRAEVSSYLQKTMDMNLSQIKDLYSAIDEQNRRLSGNLEKINEKLSSSIMDLRLSNKREMDDFSQTIRNEIEKIRNENEKSKEKLSLDMTSLLNLVRSDLDKIRADNDKKLEEMRKTVDEKLQSTLDARLSENFKMVSQNLDQLRSALSELTKLSQGVSDLNKIFGNVKSRGVWGEVQVEAILSDILSPDQYVKNFHPRPKSAEVVEFAVRLPGRDDGEVYIPIDSKFPKEDYERYVEAVNSSNENLIESSLKALRERVRKEAQDIAEKYINPPRTTDFAILFVPTESLYAELLRDPGYVDGIQNRYKVIISGPTTFSALLVSLGMGFKTLQIEKKSKEVRDLFSRIKILMEKFSQELLQTQSAIGSAGKRIDAVIKRNAMITSRLSKIELSDDENSIDIPNIAQNIGEIE